MTFPEIRINADDLARLESAVNVEGWQKALHERDEEILERNNVIALQEGLLREAREKLRGLYEERDALRQRLSEAEARSKALKLEILQIAFEYEQWLQQNGAGSTYSTFCDDFKCDVKNRSFIFKAVEEVRRCALSNAAA
jgi:hypothetical protein